MILPGSSEQLGAHWDGAGVNFAIYSADAESVELCLFEADGTASHRMHLPECADGVWHGYLLGCQPGQHYGYRVHGAYAPDRGHYFNAHKLLLDPYARQLSGPLVWNTAVYGYKQTRGGGQKQDTRDSALYMPKAIVQGDSGIAMSQRPVVTWEDTILYELNVGGYTMRHEAVADIDKGRFSGLAVQEVLQYIRSLGVTSIELLPCHAYADEHFLVEKGLRNFWGYNSLGFFAPHTRYLGQNGIDEFRHMTNAVHDAGMEVVLDVVYNHTAEGDHRGATLSFRGIDNLTYYRTLPYAPAHYINDTGCGNTINSDHPLVQRLICDSMRYWVEEMGVDGFRFDLASILGRTASGFETGHALFRKIHSDPVLAKTKLIAEPWDIGPGGYQLGNFPNGWSEWNDRYRDHVRKFWRGDDKEAPALAHGMHGSASIFEPQGRLPSASVNFITSHDGFTLADLVSYEERHNHANGEDNRDGHQHNYSRNFGEEGPTNDPTIQHSRRRQRLNLLATVLLSRGTPMLLAGDEFGNSQQGNNNAYAQDNEIGWLDWSGLQDDPSFTDSVRQLISLRHDTMLLKADIYPHGHTLTVNGEPDITWLLQNGEPLSDELWGHHRSFMMLLVDTAETIQGADEPHAVAVLINGTDHSQVFTLPGIWASPKWRCAFSSDVVEARSSDEILLQPQSMAAILYHRD